MVEYSDPRDFGFDPKTVMRALMPYEQFSSKPRRLILGIDMGIASVGVCLLDMYNHEIVLMARVERLLSLRLQLLPTNISAYSTGGTTRQKGTICFVLKLAVLNEAMRKTS